MPDPTHWYCCQCGDGPHFLAHEPSCISCSHMGCSECIGETPFYRPRMPIRPPVQRCSMMGTETLPSGRAPQDNMTDTAEMESQLDEEADQSEAGSSVNFSDIFQIPLHLSEQSAQPADSFPEDIISDSAEMKESGQSENDFRDDSSVSSYKSEGMFSLSAQSLSTVTSIGMDAVDLLTDWILGSEDVGALCFECFGLGDSGRSERNIRRLLKRLAVGLAREVSNDEEAAAVRAFRRMIRPLARTLRQRCTAETHKLPVDLLLSSKDFTMKRFLEEKVPVEKDEDPESTEELSDNGSDGFDWPEANDHQFGHKYEKHLRFFRTSEALEEFRKGLVEFRMIMMNTRHNEKVREKAEIDLYSRQRSITKGDLVEATTELSPSQYQYHGYDWVRTSAEANDFSNTTSIPYRIFKSPPPTGDIAAATLAANHAFERIADIILQEKAIRARFELCIVTGDYERSVESVGLLLETLAVNLARKQTSQKSFLVTPGFQRAVYSVAARITRRCKAENFVPSTSPAKLSASSANGRGARLLTDNVADPQDSTGSIGAHTLLPVAPHSHRHLEIESAYSRMQSRRRAREQANLLENHWRRRPEARTMALLAGGERDFFDERQVQKIYEIEPFDTHLETLSYLPTKGIPVQRNTMRQRRAIFVLLLRLGPPSLIPLACSDITEGITSAILRSDATHSLFTLCIVGGHEGQSQRNVRRLLQHLALSFIGNSSSRDQFVVTPGFRKSVTLVASCIWTRLHLTDDASSMPLARKVRMSRLPLLRGKYVQGLPMFISKAVKLGGGSDIAHLRMPVDEATGRKIPSKEARHMGSNREEKGGCSENSAPGQREGNSLLTKIHWLHYSFEQFKKLLRPSLKPGTRRLEWRCDCGTLLYADFDDSDTSALDALANALTQPSGGEPCSSDSQPAGLGLNATTRSFSSRNAPPLSQTLSDNAPSNGIRYSPTHAATHQNARPKFLALCIATGGIYKTLKELDVSQTTSDAALFHDIKKAYYDTRGINARLSILFKPVSVEFVHFNLWNTFRGYVSICDRPKCVPPADAVEYDFSPKPLIPLPPMPAEVFIHYLEHGEGDLSLNRCVWAPRLPKRLHTKMVHQDIPAYGWGIFIKEGPNRPVIFWIIMITVFSSILLSILWSAIRHDAQGGSGLGTLILTLPSVIMAAFVFRLTDST